MLQLLEMLSKKGEICLQISKSKAGLLVIYDVFFLCQDPVLHLKHKRIKTFLWVCVTPFGFLPSME